MQASALELRPTTWSEVVGYKTITDSLSKLLSEHIPNAIGFSGPPGCGKTTLAKIAASVLNGGSEGDVQEINCADKNGVDDARALAEDAQYRPTFGRYKVRILDEAHMLTQQAQNALLIPMEDADSSTKWMVCTTDPKKLIPALKSRCVWFEVPGLDRSGIETLLERAAKSIGFEPDPMLYTEAAKSGITSPRELLYGLDLYLSGTPAEECFKSDLQQEAQYVEIAKAATKSWGTLAGLLKPLKPADAKGLRLLLSSWMRTVLLNSSGAKAAATSELLIRLSAQDTFEDGVSLAATVAALYIFTSKYTA